MLSLFGLGRIDEAKLWMKKMYKANEQHLLPKGIDHYFNFEFFRMGDKNVWAYEWFDELPEDRHSTSFSKIVYYIYSSNADGTDKDQLYRLHVLMFHGSNKNFDYVLDRRFNTGKGEVGGGLFQYTYKEDIDYIKLKSDVKEVISNQSKSMMERSSSKQN